MTKAVWMGEHARSIAELASLTRRLEPDATERRRLTELAVAHTEAFLALAPAAPTFVPATDVAATLETYGIPRSPRDAAEVLDVVGRLIEQPGVATTSPRYVGYIPSGGLFTAAIADFVAAVSNRYAGQASINPGASGLEHVVVRWLADVVGLGPSAGGVLTSGGSLGTLTAVVAAREAAGIVALGESRPVVYLGQNAHHSVAGALRVAGLGACTIRAIPSDARHCMDAEALARAVRADREAGLSPFLVVATAGTTNSGSVDPLERIGQLARREDLWFHVDGAYGGLFALSPLGREVLSGIELADSVVVDPHKTLFLPYGTGAVLVRDVARLQNAFTEEADYLAPRVPSEPASPADLGPELSRHFRALRVWLPLQLAGQDAFAAALTEKILLARHVHGELTRSPRIDAGPAPDLSIVTFRAVPTAPGDVDAATRLLAAELQQGGEAFLTTTRLDGKLVLRVAIGSFRTHLPDAQRVVDVIREAVESPGASPRTRPETTDEVSERGLRLEFSAGPPDLETLACEASVLGQRYGNTAEELRIAYASYADSSAFLAVRDRSGRVLGWARLITPGAHPLKTLAEVTRPPWDVDAEDLVAQVGLDLQRTWDVTTIGVRRELGAAGSVVAGAIYHGIIAATRVNGAEWILALLDVRVRKLLDRVGLVMDTLPGTAPRPYFGSPSTVPVAAHMENLVRRQQRENPDAYRRITLGLGLPGIELPTPDEFRLHRDEVDLRGTESRTA